MFNTRNKSGISAHPCIILYLFYQINVLVFQYIAFIAIYIAKRIQNSSYSLRLTVA